MSLVEQVLAGVSGNPLSGLRQADSLWEKLKHNQLTVPQIVQQSEAPLAGVDWDVVIAGGTLGIFIGAALARRGWRVALIERGTLRGRDQEWNISRRELSVFLDLGLLSAAELEQAITTEFNPVRIRFRGGTDIWVRDVLNVGVDPVFLLATLKSRFLEAGGQLFEQTAFASAIVHTNGVDVQTSGPALKARLLLDAMGHFSPMVAQARQGERPEGVCLVVGTCAQGYAENASGDLLVSFTPIQRQCQYFWEAFPARDGRTTYLFTYLDADPLRPSLETLFADYLHLLPEYQGISLEQLQIQRALFGCFPCYRQSPLRFPWNRVLAVGDSSGSQSPLSFGGFGAMVRHLQRLETGIDQALSGDLLDHRALARLQPYQPSLAVAWLFQRAMSVGVNQSPEPDQINQLLTAVFAAMQDLGDPVLRPFLQDVVQFPALSQTLLQVSLQHPGLVAKIIPQVGLPALLDWVGHYGRLGLYSGLSTLAPWMQHSLPLAPYVRDRWLDAWRYGSGQDYHPQAP